MNYWMNSIIPFRPFGGRSRRRANRGAMNAQTKGLMGLGGLGLGAGLMFMLDPDRGRRRRALARDKMAHASRLLTRAMSATSRDLTHRVYGALAEGGKRLRREEVSDDVLADRIRARIGRSVSHPHAIKVTVNDGHVVLSGAALASEERRLLSGVSSVRGVKGVENVLTLHTNAEKVSSLQGGRPRTGDRFALRQTNWSPTTRLAAGLTGGALMANGLARRDPVSAALGALGFGLFMRSATNKEMKTLLGVGRDRRPIRVQKTINIHAPIEQVFDFWTDHRNFPRFMSRVREARPMGEGRSHWIVAGPAGLPIEWMAEITRLVPNKLLAWRSLPGSNVRHGGVIHFEPVHEGSTRVHIEMCYHPIGGAIGHALARLFGSDPKSEMDADLLRMKTFIEKGHLPHDASCPLPRDASSPLPASHKVTAHSSQMSAETTAQQAHLAGGP
ncbi:MAG: SRPBCC family protein [Blastocatellia bacterium]|nr:SRPBCC family protein [Blastocatellia bacterium]